MRTYLDHAATTPLDPQVREAMLPWLGAVPANPSSAHASGRDARRAVEEARESVAAAVGCTPLEVVFTSGGTEADNAAIKGIAWAAAAANRRHIVTTALEHHAVGDACAWLAEHQGFDLEVVAAEPDGVVRPDAVLAAIRPDTALVAVMALNNELGTVQPVDQLAPACVDRGVPLVVDAVQALGRMGLGWDVGGPAALTLSSHKHHGPHGVGVLVLRRDVPCHPLSHGGGQERDVRSGTLDVAGIVGAGVAATLAAEDLRSGEPARIRELRDRLVAAVAGADVSPTVDLGGVGPHLAHLSVPGVDTDALLARLDAEGVELSAGSACTSGARVSSHVLAAIGVPERTGFLRVSLSRTTTTDDVEAGAKAISTCVTDLRSAGGGFF